MAHYLVQASYTNQGVSGLLKNPEDRAVSLRPLVEGMGGKIESLYFSFGEFDVVVIVELPDNVTMAALSMAVGASGSVTNLKTTVLMPMSEGVEAARKAGSLSYRPPGS